MTTAAGSGYSRFEGTAVTRWREDPTRDSWGSYVFIRDVQSGRVWSAGHQPSGTEADSYEAGYFEDHVRIVRRDGNLDDGARHRRLPGGRRRAAAGLDHEPRAPRARPRADVLRRDRPERPEGGRRPPGVLEPVRVDRVRARARDARRDAPAALGRRASPVVRARLRRGGLRAGSGPVRNGSRALRRPRQRPADGGRDARAAALGHGRARARPDLQPAPPPAARTGGERACHVLHHRRALEGERARGGGPLSRPVDLRAHRDARLDRRAGRAPAPADRPRRGAPLPAAGDASRLLRSEPPRARRGPGAQHPRRRRGPLALRDLRRSTDRAAPDRADRGRRPVPADPPRAGVLAPEGPLGRPRRLQRGEAVVRLGAAVEPGDGAPDERLRKREREPRRRVHPEDEPGAAREPRRHRRGRAHRPVDSRLARRPGRALAAEAARAAASGGASLPRRRSASSRRPVRT